MEICCLKFFSNSYTLFRILIFFSFSRYDEHNNNCYDFALSFLNQILPMNLEPFQKQDFCKDFIAPSTTKAAYYIDLYRRVQQGGGVSVERCRHR